MSEQPPIEPVMCAGVLITPDMKFTIEQEFTAEPVHPPGAYPFSEMIDASTMWRQGPEVTITLRLEDGRVLRETRFNENYCK